MVGVVLLHPHPQIDVPDGQLGVGQKLGLIAGDAATPIGQIAVDESIEYPVDVQVQLRPAGELAVHGTISPAQCTDDPTLVVGQAGPPDRCFDRGVEDFRMLVEID